MSKVMPFTRQNMNGENEIKRESVRTRVMSVTSGKGGVGKTHLVSNIAISLAKQGRDVLVVDADLGLANIDVVLGLEVRRTLHDFLEGRNSLEELIVEGPEGVRIIPASSGVESILQLTAQERLYLLQAIEELAAQYDYLIIDTPAGIGSDVLSFNGASSEIVCVITPEPTSLTDAYALIKVLSRRFGERLIRIIVNEVADERQAEATFNRFHSVVQQYLRVELSYLGWVPNDPVVSQAVRQQRAFTLEYPSSKASRAVARIAGEIDSKFFEHRIKGGMQFFFRQLLNSEHHGSEGR